MRYQDCQNGTTLKLDNSKTILDVDEIPNAVLKRLIEEVRIEKLTPTTAYNRTHNRHNRGR